MTAEATTAPSRVRDRAQYGLCAALALGGLAALRSHTRLERGGVAPALAS